MLSAYGQARREPQRGPGKHFGGAPKHFHSPLWEKIFEFFFSKWYILAYFIFLAKGRAPQTSRGRGSLSPYPTLSMSLHLADSIHSDIIHFIFIATRSFYDEKRLT